MSEEVGAQLMTAVQNDPSLEIVIDIGRLTIEAPAIGLATSFPLDPSTQERFLNGLDDIALTLQHDDDIAAYESHRSAWLPSNASA